VKSNIKQVLHTKPFIPEEGDTRQIVYSLGEAEPLESEFF
jgi:hypothetical protein